MCASASNEYACCNVFVLDSVSNCPFDCSYCFLQSYLTDTTIRQTADTNALIAEVESKMAKEPDRLFRVGTWVLGDSLALEPLTGSATELVEAFAKIKNGLLELKTKSANVDDLLDLDHGGRTVVSWTMSPAKVIADEELKTATLEERISAMKKAGEAGYLLGIHFDPMIKIENCNAEYGRLAQEIFENINPDQVAWISIGSLRFKPAMKASMEKNFPKSAIASEEMVLGPDGKMRYPKPVRIDMYKNLYGAIRKYGGDEPFVYLCMERHDMFRKTIGYEPADSDDLEKMMTKSLCDRFPSSCRQ